MGQIRKLRSEELIGAVDNTDVYPVTYTDAVFNSDGSNLNTLLDNKANANHTHTIKDIDLSTEGLDIDTSNCLHLETDTNESVNQNPTFTKGINVVGDIAVNKEDNSEYDEGLNISVNNSDLYNYYIRNYVTEWLEWLYSDDATIIPLDSDSREEQKYIDVVFKDFELPTLEEFKEYSNIDAYSLYNNMVYTNASYFGKEDFIDTQELNTQIFYSLLQGGMIESELYTNTLDRQACSISMVEYNEDRAFAHNSFFYHEEPVIHKSISSFIKNKTSQGMIIFNFYSNEEEETEESEEIGHTIANSSDYYIGSETVETVDYAEVP